MTLTHAHRLELPKLHVKQVGGESERSQLVYLLLPFFFILLMRGFTFNPFDTPLLDDLCLFGVTHVTHL